MVCIKSPSRNSIRVFGLILLSAFLGCLVREADAAVAVQFSQTVGEEYSDNIFFTRPKTSDFITVFIPSFSLFYAPAGEVSPTCGANFSPAGQIYARNSNLDNFGQNLNFNTGCTYAYSPRLSFYLSDTIQRLGPTRTTSVNPTSAAFGSTPSLPTSPPPPASASPIPVGQGLSNFLSQGSVFSNYIYLGGNFLYAPNISFNANYSVGYSNYLSQGGNDLSQTIGFMGVYNWRQDHNLHAGLSVTILNPRNGKNDVAYNFNLGDDYFSNYTLQLTPTLALSASTGLSFSTASGGPGVSGNGNITATKIWERASLSAGVVSGLTPTFGVDGLAQTTQPFAQFVINFSERLTGALGVQYTFFNTQNSNSNTQTSNFSTFAASAGLRYWINTWLSTNLAYTYGWTDSGSGTTTTTTGLNPGKVSVNSVFLTLTAYFDLWPNQGLSRGLTAPSLMPVLRTPFPPPGGSTTQPTGAPTQPAAPTTQPAGPTTQPAIP